MTLPSISQTQRTLTQAEVNWLQTLQCWVQEDIELPDYEQAISEVQASFEQQLNIEPPYLGRSNDFRNRAHIRAWQQPPTNNDTADMTPSEYDQSSMDIWVNRNSEWYTSNSEYAKYIDREAKKEWVRSELERYNNSRDKIYHDQEHLRNSRNTLNQQHIAYVCDKGYSFWDYMVLSSLINNRELEVNHDDVGASEVARDDGDHDRRAYVGKLVLSFIVVFCTMGAAAYVFLLLNAPRLWRKANEQKDTTNAKAIKLSMITTSIAAATSIGSQKNALICTANFLATRFRGAYSDTAPRTHEQPHYIIAPMYALSIITVVVFLGQLMGYGLGAGVVTLRNKRLARKAIDIYERRLKAAIGEPLLQAGHIVTPEWAQAMPYELYQNNQALAERPSFISAQPLHSQIGPVPSPSAPPASSDESSSFTYTEAAPPSSSESGFVSSATTYSESSAYSSLEF